MKIKIEQGRIEIFDHMNTSTLFIVMQLNKAYLKIKNIFFKIFTKPIFWAL